MPSAPLILLVPSLAAAVELPRRVASKGRALAGLYPMRLADLARAIAEPALLSRGLTAWDPGHGALLAARLLAEERALRLSPDLPRAPVAAALARTLGALRLAGISPARVDQLAARAGATPEDAERLTAVAALYRRYDESMARFADPATLLAAAKENLSTTAWLRGAAVVLVDDLELAPLEQDFLSSLARALSVRRLDRPRPAALASSSSSSWAEAHGISPIAWNDTVLAPIASPAPAPALTRLREQLFEPPQGAAVEDDSVVLVTAPGEAAEVRALVRRLMREASRGVPFEEMGVALPRPEYAPLFTDLLERLGIPHRLHPSLPLRFGRSARSLLLLMRCRGLRRGAVMEFLTFAPIKFREILGDEVTPRPAQWDALSRDAGIVSGLDRWIIGLRAHAEAEQEAAQQEIDPDRRERRSRRVADAEALLRVVEILSATLDGLSGEASWPEWSVRLREAVDQWLAPERDRTAVLDVIADLAGLGQVAERAPWHEVEEVVEARFEWERVPLDPITTGAIHLGALDAVAGLPFRVVAIPGLVEGGFPGVLRPDPFLLDPEREALGLAAVPAPARPRSKGQLSLFEDSMIETAVPFASPRGGLPTTQDRLLEARRLFHRALSQATEHLILSYPRADARSGRERMPSLFFVAAASALRGQPVSAADLARLVVEDDLDALPLEEALDASERDRIRIARGGAEAAQAVAAGSAFFKQSRLATRARWSNRLTRYDGLITDLPPELAARLDPTTSRWPISASRLATFARCGFMYLLQYVLRLEPVLEPEERKRLEPLERGSLFHEVAERFLRERRDRGELPVCDTPEMQRRLLELADASLDALVAGSPPRLSFLWERERARFREGMLSWLVREAAAGERATPAHFEVAFGLDRPGAPGEPHAKEPLLIDLGDDRTLRVSGQIDRIDRLAEGGLVLRDYKTGRAPKDDGGVFRGGKQLQIPFYLLAAERLFPEEKVVHAFLDYVDGGRQVAVDPEVVRSETFRGLLRELVDLIGQGVFVQEPSSCVFCDFTAVCGPKGLLERRRSYKAGDRAVLRVLRLRDIA